MTLSATPAGPRHLAPDASVVRLAVSRGRRRHAAVPERGVEYDPRVDGDLLDWLGFAPAGG